MTLTEIAAALIAGFGVGYALFLHFNTERNMRRKD